MNKGELVDAISEATGKTKKDIDGIISAALDQIMKAVASGDKVTLVNFGTFEPRDRQKREGRNPRNGERMDIPATTVPAFNPGKVFKDKVAGNAANRK